MTIENTSNDYMGSITWLNQCGDIVIVWDEKNRDKILSVIQKKMDEGYTFFTTKKFMYKRLSRKVKVTPKNIDLIEEVIITDEQFDKMVDDMNDRDVATLVRADSARVVKRIGKDKIDAQQIARRAEDVINKNSVAIRPIRGG